MSGPKHRGGLLLWVSGGMNDPWKMFELVFAKSCALAHFGPEMVHNAVHNAFLNTLTMGKAFPRVPLGMTNGVRVTR